MFSGKVLILIKDYQKGYEYHTRSNFQKRSIVPGIFISDIILLKKHDLDDLDVLYSGSFPSTENFILFVMTQL